MKIKDNEDLIITEVEDEGFVAAGRTINFPAPESTTIIALPPRLAELAKKGLIKTLTIYGNSLEGVGIYDGDKVVCKKAFSKKEVTKHSICIVYIPATGEIVAKRVRFVDDWLILKSCNDDVPDIKTKPDDVDIRGIVIALHRGPDKYGRFDRGYEPEFPF